MTHADDDPVIFGYAATCNISFAGSEEKDEAREEFLYNTLGVEIYEEGAES